jgi:REP element-mobilizing transposase RayT
MATARRLLVDPAVGGVFHCVSRCVRRAFLCGQDRYSGRDFEHRRAWVRDRLRAMTDVFAVRVFSYVVMSNHLHVVLGTDPAGVSAWCDAEVARRWLTIFPGPGGRRGRPPEESVIQALCRDAGRLATCRARLADVSWFMRCLNEPIARRANREDECTGRFWEGRFKCQRLEDAGALLACMVYVDLNPVRAGLAATPESSDFTSGQDRTVACRARQELAAAPALPTPARTEASRDHWLVGFAASGEGSSETGAAAPRQDPADRSLCPRSTTRLSHISLESYLELLDWTGREVRAGKAGQISPHLRPVLQRLDLDVEAWVENVELYGSLFHRLVGKVHRLQAWARATGRAWLHGHRGARRLYTQAAQPA